jgi:translation initiation factor IF-2
MLFNDRNKPVKEAGPSVPVEILGLDELPDAGDRLFALDKGADLKSIVAKREEEARRAGLDAGVVPKDEAGVWDVLAKQEIKRVNIILKADVQGTLQVLKRELAKLGNEEVRCKILLDGVGGITTADVQLAFASDATIVGFNVVAESKARSLAREKDVRIHTHSIIYELLDDAKNILAGALDPEEHEEVLGMVEIRKVFKSSKLGNIAGCFVEEGIVRRNAHVRLARDGIVLWQGELDSLRRFSEDVQEVRENFECGIKLKGYDDIKEGDQLEVFEIQKIARTLD